MKKYLKRLLIVYTGLFLFLNLVQCSSMGKITPEYKGVDPKLEHFVKEYKELAEMQGIKFKREVTLGFKNLKGDTVGLTTYGAFDNFREIDIDTNFYNNSTEVTKETLLFHELSHAYCTRKHDFGNSGQKYPEYETWRKNKQPKIGRYKDGTNCPLSIMYPEVLDDFCMLTHFTDYIIEMYNRCDPY